MDNGNGGPGNRIGENFERSMAEAPKFDSEVLPTPESKETENNPGVYIDPSMLGNMTVNAAGFNEQIKPALGEVVSESEAGMKALTEAQVIGTDVDIRSFKRTVYLRN